MSTTTGKHPAPYHDRIVDEIGTLAGIWLPPGIVVHDPFAGDGRKLAALCDRLGYTYSGTDLEMWASADHRVRVADATRADSYPADEFVVITSPTYNNGMNDSFNPRDTSIRMTYRVAAGHQLDLTNTGRWSGRGSDTHECRYWDLSRQAVQHWPSMVFVNVKDSIRAGVVYPLVNMWRKVLEEFGYTVEQVAEVKTPGNRRGQNHDARVDAEHIIVARRRAHLTRAA